jgi:hypothetical protein
MPGRQASDVTHELGHALLLHPPAPALDHRGCRLWDHNIEDEAQWLAGALLLTEDAALWIIGSRMPVTTAAERFGISEQMITYRINMTGARTRVARARRFRVVRLASIPGAVIQLRPGLLVGSAYGRDLGGCHQLSSRPQADLNQPGTRNRRSPARNPQVTNATTPALSRFAPGSSWHLLRKLVEVMASALVSDARNTQAPVQSASRESRLASVSGDHFGPSPGPLAHSRPAPTGRGRALGRAVLFASTQPS